LGLIGIGFILVDFPFDKGSKTFGVLSLLLPLEKAANT
jgi:hypothetical protein